MLCAQIDMVLKTTLTVQDSDSTRFSILCSMYVPLESVIFLSHDEEKLEVYDHQIQSIFTRILQQSEEPTRVYKESGCLALIEE
ncbi:hypothetical protein [Bartonella taylorii]|uniref:hypothetical protein n=1 Tax=Bartonella taylorii TaxID=33046 RepID=UPI001ABBD34B|nr:hypothetical protein [Bartonella taylorii]